MIQPSERKLLADLGPWCHQWLGAEPAYVLFDAGHLSKVIGLELIDGRAVVVKLRPQQHRLQACVQVQRHLWEAGFPCPQPLAGPTPLGDLAATAETLVAGGAQLVGPEAPRRFAQLFFALVNLAQPPQSLPTLDPALPWVGWDHDQPGVWPIADDGQPDLNGHPGPTWLDELAARVRVRLARSHHDPVVGHGDWESQNIRWLDGLPHAVHDWDSVVARPEPALVGAAAAVFPATGAPDEAATLEETSAFIAAYEEARGTPWDDDQRQVSWAAGLWVRAFNAKKAALQADGGSVLRHLEIEVVDRLRLAGA